MTPEQRRAVLLASWYYGEAWRHPDLLDANQREAVRLLFESEGGAYSWMWGRQVGKSFTAFTAACCLAQANPGSISRYAALTGKSAAAIAIPTVQAITDTMPAEVRPRVRNDVGLLEWANGSTLTWAGTDNEQFDRLRGPRAHLILLDESAFYGSLERIESALLPQLTTTHGSVVYLSTPPESPAHPFLARHRAAQAAGRASHRTIHDNPRLGPEGVRAIEVFEAGRLGLTVEELRASTYWRREYLAEVVTEETRAAVPAWTPEAQSACVRAVQRPPHFDGYVGLDLGFQPDPHGALFAWLDYPSATLVVESEVELRGATVAQLAEALKARETETWGAKKWDGTLSAATTWVNLPDWLKAKAHARAPRQPFMRVGDDDALVLAELAGSHGYAVLPTRKDEKHLAVDALNQLVRARRIAIHPRCVRLIEQLYSTVWNKARTQWERTAKDHGDLVDALVYLVRNVVWSRDVRPPVETWELRQEKPSGLTGLSMRRR